jgi:hypothetical protein
LVFFALEKKEKLRNQGDSRGSLKNHSDQDKNQSQDHRIAERPDDDCPLHHRSQFAGRHVSDFGGFGHFGCGSVVCDESDGQVSSIGYLEQKGNVVASGIDQDAPLDGVAVVSRSGG